jgi:hypothetical protein
MAWAIVCRFFDDFSTAVSEAGNSSSVRFGVAGFSVFLGGLGLEAGFSSASPSSSALAAAFF